MSSARQKTCPSSMSPHGILKSHLTQLLDVINDPERLANDLSVADLIAGPVKNKVLELSNTNYKKASILVNEVLTSLKVFDEPKTLVKFCDILKSQDNANLVRIANSILRALGIDVPEDRPPISEQGTTSEDIHQPAPVRRPSKKSKPINPAVLRKYHGDICSVLNVSKESLQSFAQKLFGEEIINKETKISVIRTGGTEGADELLNHIELKVEQNPDYLHVVLELMENDEYLRDIVKKIRGGNTTKTAPFRRQPEVSKPREYLDEIVTNDENQKPIPSVSDSPPPAITKPSSSNKKFVYFLISITVLITATGIIIGVLHFYGFELKSVQYTTTITSSIYTHPSPSETDKSSEDSGRQESVATQRTVNNTGDNINDVQYVENEKAELKGDGTGGPIPDDENLLYYLSGITEIQSLCYSFGLGSERCSEIVKQHSYLDDQKAEILRNWKQLRARTWKEFVHSLGLLKKCSVAKELASEYSVYFNSSDWEDKKVLNNCEDINGYVK